MEVSLTDFKRAVSGVLKTAPPSAIQENLAYLVIIKKGKKMRFRTLNGVLDAEYTIDTTGKDNFALAVSVGDFSKYVSSLRGDTCTLVFDEEENKLVVNDNKQSIATFSTRDSDLIPMLFDDAEVGEYKLPFHDFVEAIKSCIWATDYRIGVLVQNSVFLLGNGEEIDILGTNRLVLVNKKLKIKHKAFEAILPHQAASALLKFPQSEEITMNLYKDMIQFSVDNFVVKSVLVSVNHPKFDENLTPPKNADVLTINREELLSAIPTVASIEHQLSALSMKADGQILEIERISQKGNSSKAVVACSGESEFTINSNYLLGVLNHIGGETVKLHIDGSKAVIVSDEDKSYRAVVALIS